jgi:hypothetical protein
MQFSTFYCHDEVSAIPTTTGGSAMPFVSTYMAPGVYTLGGQSWDCTRPGLYRFKHPNEAFFRNRITTTNPTGDVYALISAICHNHIHGVADEGVEYQTMSNRGMQVRWRLRCGVIAGMCAWLLPQVGVSSRVINVKTVGPLTGYDDGHLVLETYHSGAWRMWDLTNRCYWRDGTGKHLSTAEFIAHIAGGAPMPEQVKLAPGEAWDAEVAVVGGNRLDLGLYGEHVISPNPDTWFRRIFQSIV